MGAVGWSDFSGVDPGVLRGDWFSDVRVFDDAAVVDAIQIDELGVVVGVEDVGGDVAEFAVVEGLEDVKKDVRPSSSDNLDVTDRVTLNDVGEELDEPGFAVFDRGGVLGETLSGIGVDRRARSLRRRWLRDRGVVRCRVVGPSGELSSSVQAQVLSVVARRAPREVLG